MWRFDSDTDPGYWERVDSPTSVALHDMASTANGPVAVGNQGIAIGRGRERWGIILENGPGAKGRALYAVDATDDGKRVWFAGAGGALGYYDIVTEERRDYSVPRGNANGFYALAVAGDRGSEKFLVGDGSGHVLPGHMEEGNETDWSWSTTPSGGNAVEALTHDDEGYGYAVTANGNVFMTTEEHDWERIGIDDAQNSFYDCSFDDEVLLAGGGGGIVHEAEKLLDHDRHVEWTPTNLGGFAVYGLATGHGAQLACGEGGNIHVRMEGGEWEQGHYDRSTTFNAALVDDPMIAVGDNGLIVERRDEPPEPDDGAGDGETDGSDSQSDDADEPDAADGEGDESDTADSDGDEQSDDSESAGSGADDGGTKGDGETTDDGGTERDSGTEGDGGTKGDGETTDDGGTQEGDSGTAEHGETEDDDSQEVAVTESDDGWERATSTSADGDPFDGHGENHDGDGNEPERFDESTAVRQSDEATCEQTVQVSTDSVEGSGNDPPDDPDDEDNDPADEPDGGSGDSGNDPADDPDDEDNDPPDEPDQPDDG